MLGEKHTNPRTFRFHPIIVRIIIYRRHYVRSPSHSPLVPLQYPVALSHSALTNAIK